ncbi:alginate lyase family protein [Pseudomonadales bacterium]|nr:alginate lyase family protein [Pseudomonadales bacterium]
MSNYINQAGRYWRTLKHLQAGQILNRLSRRFLPSKSPLVVIPLVSQFKPNIDWPSKKESILTNSRFLFLNEEKALNFPGDWENKSIPLLWVYNLHYHDGLLSVDTELDLKKTHIRQWLAGNSSISGVGWDPYPISLRVVNWIKWNWISKEYIENFDRSLAIQISHLYYSLEYHLMGNHLLENAKALIFGGCYFEGGVAMRWLNKGLTILDKQLSEQILEDGGHFELSPMYHSIMLELVLDLLALSKKMDSPSALRSRRSMLSAVAQKMSSWLAIMVHPDNEISFFNDASTGIALSPKTLEGYLNTLEATPIEPDVFGVTYLSTSGYIRMENKFGTVFADVAEIGPSYLPGHGHADALSIEFSLFGLRLFVNLGTSEYGQGARRDFERSTAAHSTLELNGENSSEIWSGFRVGRRARVSNVYIKSDESQYELVAQHNGYRYLSGRPVHSRRILFSEGELEIIDEINKNSHLVCVRFHIHPRIKLFISEGGSRGFLTFPDGCEVVWESDADLVFEEDNEYAWEFGKKIPMKTLVLQQNKSNSSTFKVKWLCR